MDGCVWRKQKFFRGGVKAFQKVKVLAKPNPESMSVKSWLIIAANAH
jgi:hypothetical protein